MGELTRRRLLGGAGAGTAEPSAQLERALGGWQPVNDALLTAG